jgi:hypothetical protein
MRSRWQRLRLLLLSAMLFVNGWVAARFDTAPTVDTHSSIGSSGSAAVGLRVRSDPETGEIVTTPEAVGVSFAPSTRDALRQSADGLTIVERSDGSKHVDLRGRYSCATVVHVGPDGVVQRCVSSPAEAEAARRAAVADRRAGEVE